MADAVVPDGDSLADDGTFAAYHSAVAPVGVDNRSLWLADTRDSIVGPRPAAVAAAADADAVVVVVVGIAAAVASAAVAAYVVPVRAIDGQPDPSPPASCPEPPASRETYT